MTTRVKTECLVDIYEIDGKDTSPDRPSIIVRSTWNDPEKVIVQIGPSQPVTVVVGDLMAAIRKASGGP